MAPKKNGLPLQTKQPGIPLAQTQFLPEILAGIDIDKGLKHVGNNRKLYKKLLLDFYQDHHDDINALDQAIKEGRLGIAQRLAHTIKGVSGAIGAVDLHVCSENMDLVLKNREEQHYGNKLAEIKTAMTVVMDSLAELTSTSDKQKSGIKAGEISLDVDSVIQALDEISHLIEEMDPDAEEKAGHLKEQLYGTPYTNLVKKLSRQVEEFEFEDASATVSLLTKAVMDNTKKES
jgi:HPt (histidine-containing phosphotransfer) domain-containing protein